VPARSRRAREREKRFEEVRGWEDDGEAKKDSGDEKKKSFFRALFASHGPARSVLKGAFVQKVKP